MQPAHLVEHWRHPAAATGVTAVAQSQAARFLAEQHRGKQGEAHALEALAIHRPAGSQRKRNGWPAFESERREAAAVQMLRAG